MRSYFLTTKSVRAVSSTSMGTWRHAKWHPESENPIEGMNGFTSLASPRIFLCVNLCVKTFPKYAKTDKSKKNLPTLNPTISNSSIP